MWCVLALVSAAAASPVEFYGFGARRMGRAGAGWVLPDGADAVLANPAALPGLDHAELSVGFLHAGGELFDLPEVWWDTNQDGVLDELDTPLDVGPTFDPVTGAFLGLAVPIGDRGAVGVALFTPVNRLLRLETFEPSLPTYFLYDNRTQRYELAVTGAWRPWGGIAVGAGVQMIPRARFALTGTLEATVSGAEAGDEGAGDVVALAMDVHRLELDLVPGFAPLLALQWDAGEVVPALDGLVVGGGWRGEAGLPVDVSLDLQVDVGTEAIGDLEDIDLPVLLALELGLYDHYLPSQLNLGAAYTLADALTVSVDLRRTAWDEMRLSIATVTASSVEGGMIDLGEDPVADGNPYSVTLAPTWAPRAGVDVRFPRIDAGRAFGETAIVARGGFGYEPTPLRGQSVDTALLDADRYIFALGAGVEHHDPFRSKGDQRVRWDAFFQYHLLRGGSLQRPDPGVPTPGHAVDGSAYPIGGHLLAAGGQWSIEY